jgi:hypothetical protein
MGILGREEEKEVVKKLGSLVVKKKYETDHTFAATENRVRHGLHPDICR